MNNQVFLWLMLIVPWVTVFLMDREDVKRFLPVGLVTAVTSIIINEVGVSQGFWTIHENLYLIRIPAYLLGLNPVATMWVFKFTYKHFWLFAVLEIVFNLGFSYLFFPFLQSRGIFEIFRGTPLTTFIMSTIHGLLLYVYQMWQDDIFVSRRKMF